MTTALDRFQELPRAIHWLTYAVLFIVLFLAWDRLLGPVAQGWNDRADSIERQVSSVQNATGLNEDFKRRQQPIVALGGVELPGDDQEGRSAISRIVTEVLQDNRTNGEHKVGPARRLPKATDAALAPWGSGKRLMQISTDVGFEAAPDDAIEIISQLESRSEIESISSIRITKGSGRNIVVDLTIEAWVYGS